MNRLLFGGAVGALAMYFLDPREGRRRRARTLDKAAHARRVMNEAAKVTMRDTVQRTSGLLAEARRGFQPAGTAGEVLKGRVRAAIGRVVSHPHAVEVHAEGGLVFLEGPVLARELRGLLRCVRSVPGVRGVRHRMRVYREAGNVSSLQGGVPRNGGRFELLQENWSPAARLAVGALGASFLALSTRARGLSCALLGASGAAMIARAGANRSLASLLGLTDAPDGIVVQKTINVQAPRDRVFAFWTDYEKLPRCTRNIREVQVDGNRSRWRVTGPAGVPVEWRSELLERVDGERLRWRSTPDSAVKHEGVVRFEDNGNGGTRVTVRLCYVPPAGALGHALASLFGADPKSEMDDDLMRMKTTIETGHPPHDAARPAHAPLH